MDNMWRDYEVTSKRTARRNGNMAYLVIRAAAACWTWTTPSADTKGEFVFR